MRKSFTKLYIHCIWALKNRKKILQKSVRETLFNHIKKYCSHQNIHLLEINGYLDHVHVLLDQNPSKALSEELNLIKGESSHWMNSHDIIPGKFAWQVRYSAFSVSSSQKEKIVDYIRNQETHHKKLNYLEELKTLYDKYELEFKEDGLG